MKMMKIKVNQIFLLYLLVVNNLAMAASIDMHDFIRLKTGMSEAEVLYRVGPYDHETVTYGYYGTLYKIWYYIPAINETSNKKWITEIKFDNSGRISALDRYKLR